MLQLLQNVPVYSTVCNPGVQSLSGQLPAAEVEGSSQGSVCSLYGFLKVWFLIVRSSVFQIKETAELLPLGLATTASALGLQLILLPQMCRLPAMAFGGPCTWRLGQVSTWSLAMLNCFQRQTIACLPHFTTCCSISHSSLSCHSSPSWKFHPF